MRNKKDNARKIKKWGIINYIFHDVFNRYYLELYVSRSTHGGYVNAILFNSVTNFYENFGTDIVKSKTKKEALLINKEILNMLKQKKYQVDIQKQEIRLIRGN